MTLSSMVLSRDWQEVGVLECILGGLHIGVDVESEPQRAQAKLAKAKVDALIVDCDLNGAAGFLRMLRQQPIQNSVPLVIVSGSSGRNSLEATGATFVFEKPISVEQAVHTLSAARNMILDGRLRYHRHCMNLPLSLSAGTKTRLEATVTNLSQGGLGIQTRCPLPGGPLRLSFSLPGSDLVVKALGRVAWTDKQGNAGIRFVQISRRSKRDLQLWLEREYFTA
ncbi:MAG TPA: PilZ domain-containing protein [Terriglobales bacterium]|nr:PilZ domain-containing protein [Terriglobales bacterium]